MAISLLPVGAFHYIAAKVDALRLLYLGVPACFVVAVTAWRIGQEVFWPAGPDLPDESDQPRGVLSQAEAAQRLDEFLGAQWERERER